MYISFYKVNYQKKKNSYQNYNLAMSTDPCLPIPKRKWDLLFPRGRQERTLSIQA